MTNFILDQFAALVNNCFLDEESLLLFTIQNRNIQVLVVRNYLRESFTFLKCLESEGG